MNSVIQVSSPGTKEEKIKSRREYCREYYIRNKERISARQKIFRSLNREMIKARRAEYQAKNKEKLRIKRKERTRLQREKIKLSRKKYEDTSRGKIRQRNPETKDKKNNSLYSCFNNFEDLFTKTIVELDGELDAIISDLI